MTLNQNPSWVFHVSGPSQGAAAVSGDGGEMQDYDMFDHDEEFEEDLGRPSRRPEPSLLPAEWQEDPAPTHTFGRLRPNNLKQLTFPGAKPLDFDYFFQPFQRVHQASDDPDNMQSVLVPSDSLAPQQGCQITFCIECACHVGVLVCDTTPASTCNIHTSLGR